MWDERLGGGWLVHIGCAFVDCCWSTRMWVQVKCWLLNGGLG